MGRKILVLCSILGLVSGIISIISVGSNVTVEKPQEKPSCDNDDLIVNLPILI